MEIISLTKPHDLLNNALSYQAKVHSIVVVHENLKIFPFICREYDHIWADIDDSHFHPPRHFSPLPFFPPLSDRYFSFI